MYSSLVAVPMVGMRQAVRKIKDDVPCDGGAPLVWSSRLFPELELGPVMNGVGGCPEERETRLEGGSLRAC